MELAAKTMGRLALVFSGSKASEYVEFEVERAFEWLRRDRIEVSDFCWNIESEQLISRVGDMQLF